MPETTNAVPNPGSDEAYALGCKCARMDNAYGRGYMGGMSDPRTGETMFVTRVGCPVHCHDDIRAKEEK